VNSYLLQISTPSGIELKRFETERDLEALGMVRTWPPDEATANDNMRDLMRWLGLPIEWQEWYSIFKDVESEGEW